MERQDIGDSIVLGVITVFSFIVVGGFLLTPSPIYRDLSLSSIYVYSILLIPVFFIIVVLDLSYKIHQ